MSKRVLIIRAIFGKIRYENVIKLSNDSYCVPYRTVLESSWNIRSSLYFSYYSVTLLRVDLESQIFMISYKRTSLKSCCKQIVHHTTEYNYCSECCPFLFPVVSRVGLRSCRPSCRWTSWEASMIAHTDFSSWPVNFLFGFDWWHIRDLQHPLVVLLYTGEMPTSRLLMAWRAEDSRRIRRTTTSGMGIAPWLTRTGMTVRRHSSTALRV